MSSLSPKQVEDYLHRISVPPETTDLLREGPSGKRALEAVTTLQQHHMAAVPFENLDQHYTSKRTHPQQVPVVYESVMRRNRGGTCTQIHQLWAELLGSFGFTVYFTGGRINAGVSISVDANADKHQVTYGPFNHIVVVVIIGGQRYVVDTIVGVIASPFPIPLVHDEPVTDVWRRQRRVIHATLPGSASDMSWWRIQLRDRDDDPWIDSYCLTGIEWHPLDIQVMVAGFDALGLAWFKYRVACMRFIFEDGVPVGHVFMFHNEVRRHYKGETSLIQKLYSEADRIDALETEFSIKLTTEEQKQIVGTEAELKDDGHDFYG